MPMPGRTYTGSDDYRYGFNGMEGDDELKGNGNSYTTHFRQYDPRIGKWLSLDPKMNKFAWQSPYVSMDNNPIVYYDPLGDEVVNGDRVKADAKKDQMESAGNQLNEFKASNKIGDNSSRRDFLKQGGSRKNWRKFKELKGDYKNAKSNFEAADNRANKTQAIIDKWEKASPNIFKTVDAQEVDFILYTKSPKDMAFEQKGFGNTKPEYVPPKTNATAPSSMTVTISDAVNILTKDLETGQFSLNHEAGHFLYISLYTCDYVQYYYDAMANGTLVSGGHAIDDESGKVADKLGAEKDIPAPNPVIFVDGN